MKTNYSTALNYIKQIDVITYLAGITDPYEGEKVFKKLVRLEKKCNRLFTNDCNGVSNLTEEEEATRDEKLLKSIKKLLPVSTTVFLNGDPRGYSIKIKEEEAIQIEARTGKRIHTDFSGYGIIAPDFN